jgi:dUTP pyrophosphatase
LEEPLYIPLGAVAKVPLGFAMALPDEFCADVIGRSGRTLAGQYFVHHGLIDADYRGEVCAMVEAASEWVFVQPGDKIAQMVIRRAEVLGVRVVPELSTTVRGEGGFGSTDGRQA